MPGCFTCITEYNEAETVTLFGAQKKLKEEPKEEREGEAIGEARGRAEEKINTLSNWLKTVCFL